MLLLPKSLNYLHSEQIFGLAHVAIWSTPMCDVSFLMRARPWENKERKKEIAAWVVYMYEELSTVWKWYVVTDGWTEGEMFQQSWRDVLEIWN